MASAESFVIHLNGRPMSVHAGMTVAAVILEAGSASRLSVRGDRRQPLCGMGVCYECRALIDGEAHQRSCQILCRPGMTVVAG